MGISTLQMALISLIPSLAICVFVYIKDRKEKEPLWLLALLFALSAVIYIPLYYLCGLINSGFAGAFSSEFSKNLATGMTVWSSTGSKASYLLLTSFIGTALIEEIARWLILYFVTVRSKYFDCLFDGVVYSVFVSMGAAVTRSVIIAFESGWELFLLKLLSSFPWYLFFGIVMGILYTSWHTKRSANEKENRMIKDGILKKDRIRYPAFSLVSSILIPVLIHGFYSFVTALRAPGYNLLFGIVIALMMCVCIVLIIVFSKKDKTKREAIDEMIKTYHKGGEGEIEDA